jgi:hypothetical protein
MRKHYRSEDLGVGVRGKYTAAYKQGTNLVLLKPEVAAAFPTSAAVNDALTGLLKVARTAKITSASNGKVTPARSGARSTRRTG